jgi:hypothetical protein
MSKMLLLFLVGALLPRIGNSQTHPVMDSVVLEIDQQLELLLGDSSIRRVEVSFPELNEFLLAHPEFNEFFGNSEKEELPRLSYSILNNAVVRVGFRYSGFMKRSNFTYDFQDEQPVKKESSYQHYRQPTSMSSCNKWAGSRSRTYYQDNVSYKTFSSSDPCAIPQFDLPDGMPIDSEWYEKMLTLIHKLDVEIE